MTGRRTLTLTIVLMMLGVLLIGVMSPPAAADCPPPAALRVTPDRTLVSAAVTVEGQGFNPGSVVQLRAAGGPGLGSVSVDGSGQFRTTVAGGIPPGRWMIQAQGPGGCQAEDSLEVVPSVDAWCPPEPTLTANPARADRGAAITVEGGGFPPGSPVNVVARQPTTGEELPGTHSANSSGSFSFTLIVPADMHTGRWNVVAEGAGDCDQKVRFDLNCPYSPAGEANPTPAVGGETVRIRGSGFTPGAAVTFDLGPVGTMEATAGAGGAVEASIALPLDTPLGSHGVAMYDGYDCAATAPFSVAAGEGGGSDADPPADDPPDPEPIEDEPPPDPADTSDTTAGASGDDASGTGAAPATTAAPGSGETSTTTLVGTTTTLSAESTTTTADPALVLADATDDDGGMSGWVIALLIGIGAAVLIAVGILIGQRRDESPEARAGTGR